MVQHTCLDEDTFEVIELQQRKLKGIQRSLMISDTGCSIDPFVLQLADENLARVFICDSDLEKVCRKANKSYHFWLFNDCIVFGNSIVRGRYRFLRKLDLLTCSIAVFPSITYEHAIKISDAGKSFVVVASTENLQKEWVHLVSSAIAVLRRDPGQSGSNPSRLNSGKSILHSSLPGPVQRNDSGIDMHEDSIQKTDGVHINESLVNAPSSIAAVECALCSQVHQEHNNIV